MRTIHVLRDISIYQNYVPYTMTNYSTCWDLRCRGILFLLPRHSRTAVDRAVVAVRRRRTRVSGRQLQGEFCFYYPAILGLLWIDVFTGSDVEIIACHD